MLQLSATPPRPSSPIRVQADLGKTLNFQISLMNETKDKLTFVQAVTMQNDVKALYKQLSSTQAGTAQVGKSGKSTTTEQIIDGKKML